MLDPNTARQCHETILHSSLRDLREELYAAALRYAQYRAEWMMGAVDARREMDPARSRAHDAFIGTCNVMSREMGKIGEDNGWRDRLTQDRKVIGDFACYVHLFLSLAAR